VLNQFSTGTTFPLSFFLYEYTPLPYITWEVNKLVDAGDEGKEWIRSNKNIYKTIRNIH
jgi:hypothetical protein